MGIKTRIASLALVLVLLGSAEVRAQEWFWAAQYQAALSSGDTVTLELDCIDRAYYDFISSSQLEIAPNYPLFSGPPANVSSNIDNGAYGTFTAYEVLRTSVINHPRSRATRD